MGRIVEFAAKGSCPCKNPECGLVLVEAVVTSDALGRKNREWVGACAVIAHDEAQRRHAENPVLVKRRAKRR